MARLLYKNMCPYSLTINTNAINPDMPTTFTVRSGDTFVGESTDLALLSLINSGAVIASPTVFSAGVGTASGVAGLDSSALLPDTQQTKFGEIASYTRATTGVQTLLAASTVTRVVMIHVLVDTVFANGDGAQPTFSFGQTGTAAKFGATSLLTGAAAGTKIVLAGELTAGAALIITAVAATGTTSTGAITVTGIAVPEL